MSRLPLLFSARRRKYRAMLVFLLLVATATAAAAVTRPGSAATKLEEEADEALVYGNNVLRSTPTLEQFDTEPAFPTAETLFLLGRAHDEGREDVGIKRDEETARTLYESAAKRGHPQAQHALSTILAGSAGDGGEDVEAILYDFFASLGGDPLAHAALGYRYLYGIGTPQSCQQSLLHYHMAAREVVADLYSDGRGGIARTIDRTRLSERLVAGRRPASDSDREMVDMWQAAAEIGEVGSIRAMGLLYQHGVRGVEQDFKKAYEMFERGADLRDLHCTAYAANLLMRGAGVPVDYEAAFRMFKISKASPVSLNGLGYLHFHGLGGAKKSLLKALEYFEQAIKEDKENQHADVHFNRGMFHLSKQLPGGDVGDDVSATGKAEIDGISAETAMALIRDPQRALVSLANAANLGHVEAMFQAALLYADEDPLTSSRCKSAVHWMKNVVERGPWMENMRVALRRATAGDYGGASVLYSRLAEVGIEVAQSNAAWLLEAGHCSGASVNGTKVACEKRALRLYEHAARQGLASAEMKVGNFHYHGKAGLPVDYEKAAEKYLRASDAKHAEALFGMGYLHQIGKGVPQDLFLAKRYFDDAAVHSTDAVPVVRLSLFLLRLQSTWMSWREWWQGLQSSASERVDKDGGGGRRGGQEAFSLYETLSLVGLAVMLLIVVGERKRRQRARRRGEVGDEHDDMSWD